MKLCTNTDTDIMNDWLLSDQAARICGLDLKPIPHPFLANSVQSVIKGQASVFFLKQIPQGNIWLLKKFTPARRPADDYLESINSCLPGETGFFTCTQRRLLTVNHLSIRDSAYKNADLKDILKGTILMPKVPGSSWASIAEDLRDNSLQLSMIERLQISLNLAGCISLLESSQCSHRDLSSTNVFIDNRGEIYLIDWDCLYHPQLSFQLNTTIGTNGYIAPFLKLEDGNLEASVSWCEQSDRFSLAVLIAEIILVNSYTPPPHEDGTLFSQLQLYERENEFVKEQLDWLRTNSNECADLFEQARKASYFQDCPSPSDWISALKHNLRQHNSNITKPQGNQYTQVVCNDCKKTFGMSKAKYDRLKAENKSILCKECFKVKLDKWSAERAQQNLLRPEVVCEHCQKTFRITRKKLDTLRQRAKPVLCSNCLTKQLERWEGEKAIFESSHLKIKCKLCSETFLVSKDKRELLLSEGKDIFCRRCFESKINSNWRL